MAQFNPDLLLKDELSYEALLRGLPHANVTVAELRRSIRECGFDTPVQLNYLSEREICNAKYSELTLLSQTLQDEKSPAIILRTTQRIEHLTRRIKNLSIWPNLTEIPVDVQNLADEALRRLPSIIIHLAILTTKYFSILTLT